ncbi:hypothetical protein ABPG72_019342 [Tetrahymena utriculariae]
MASNSFSRFLIKTASNVGGIFMVYSIYEIYKREKSLKKYEAIKQHKQRLGQEFTEDDYDKEDREYIDQHYGRKLAEKVYTQHLAEDQIKMALQRKKEIRDKMKENLDEDQLKQVDDEIKKLDEAFTRLRPKVIPRMAQFVNDKDR